MVFNFISLMLVKYFYLFKFKWKFSQTNTRRVNNTSLTNYLIIIFSHKNLFIEGFTSTASKHGAFWCQLNIFYDTKYELCTFIDLFSFFIFISRTSTQYHIIFIDWSVYVTRTALLILGAVIRGGLWGPYTPPPQNTRIKYNKNS